MMTGIHRATRFVVPLLLGLLLMPGEPAVRAADEAAPVRHRILFFEYGNTPNRMVEVDEAGKIVWEYKPPSIAVIFQVLPNGNVLFGYGGKPTGAMEIDRKGKTIWNYESHCPQVFGCERLPNGNTLVAEQGPPQVVEVNPAGEVVHTTRLQTNVEHFHQQVRNVHLLPNGNILAAHEGEGAVREYASDGKVVWEYTGVANTGEARRLENGNTLIAAATQKRLIEVSPDKKIVWEFKADDAPQLNLTWVSSLQLLPNGDYLVGNFLRGQEGKGAHAFQVTHDKKVVWTFTDHEHFKSITTVRAVDEQK